MLQIAAQLLPLISAAIAIPVINNNLGRAAFGVFTIGLSFLGLFSLLDLGLGRAAVRFMARPFARGDLTAAASIAVHAALLLGAFSIALCALFGIFIPTLVSHWFRPAAEQSRALVSSLYILAAVLPFAGLTSVARSVLEARDEFRTIAAIQSGFGIITYVAPLALSFETSDVRLLIAAATLCRVLAFGAFSICALNAWHGKFPWRAVDLSGQREFRSFSLWLVISNLIGTGIVYGDRALLVRFFGLAQVPYYLIPLELLSRAMIVVNSAVTVTFPTLSRSAGDKRVLGRTFAAFMTLVGGGTGFVLLMVSMAAPIGLDRWMGKDFSTHSLPIVRILLVGLAFQGLSAFALAWLNARGVARPITLLHLAEAPAYIVALYWCATHYGLSGMAWVWSGRVAFEYVFFASLLIYDGSKEKLDRQVTGLALAGCGVVPVFAMALNGSGTLAVAASTLVTAACTAWGSWTLRMTYHQTVELRE